jgi:hypothetical protein
MARETGPGRKVLLAEANRAGCAQDDSGDGMEAGAGMSCQDQQASMPLSS